MELRSFEFRVSSSVLHPVRLRREVGFCALDPGVSPRLTLATFCHAFGGKTHQLPMILLTNDPWRCTR